MDSVSPILLQPFNPICSYGNMYYNYEGILVKFLNLIDDRRWKEFDFLLFSQAPKIHCKEYQSPEIH